MKTLCKNMGLCVSKSDEIAESSSSGPEKITVKGHKDGNGHSLNQKKNTASQQSGWTQTESSGKDSPSSESGTGAGSSRLRGDRHPNKVKSEKPNGGNGGKNRGNENLSSRGSSEQTELAQALSLKGSNSVQELEQSKKQPGNGENRALKVLLLGSGESGKSTVLQQLKIMHQNGFTREELLEYKPFIFDNIIETGKDLVNARRKFKVELEEDSGLTDLELDGLLEVQLQNTGQLENLSDDLWKNLKLLWNLNSTQELIAGEHRSSFYLMDSARYFYENLDRISSPNYIPTVTDVLRTRKKTSGIFDTMVELDKNLKMHIYDVGGQRSERKKWIHCFDNVTLIIFCVSLSEYDQTLLEDNSQNRLEESLILFDSVVNSRWFARSSIVLFLNKIDIFAEKIQHVPLERYFPDYTGGKDINKAAKYILWRFVQLNRANINIYPHVTQATDTSNISLVFAAIKETILENSLKDSGVL